MMSIVLTRYTLSWYVSDGISTSLYAKILIQELTQHNTTIRVCECTEEIEESKLSRKGTKSEADHRPGISYTNDQCTDESDLCCVHRILNGGCC